MPIEPQIPQESHTRSRLIIGALISCYAFALIVPQLLPATAPLSRTFNSMLDHLLRGRFDVDPAIVGIEGFARGDRIYAYWGPLPALLRVPMLVLPHWRTLDFTIPYCVIALLAMLMVKLWTVGWIARHSPRMPPMLLRALYLVIALSGAQLCFLRFSLYQEVCLWASLCGAVFVAAAVVAQQRADRDRAWLVMALAANAAVLTRVSVGIGLIAALLLLLAVETLRARAEWRGALRQCALPLFVLALGALAAAGVNYARWGNPLTFADYQVYLFNQRFPDRMARTALYGLFNGARIPFGLVYYFAPVWVLPGADGHLLLEATRSRLIDSAELPPSSFFVTDPLLLLLGAVAIMRWSTKPSAAGLTGGAIAAGLALPPLLMLSAISMCFRYRMDFYPLIEFLAFSGFAMAGRGAVVGRAWLIWTLATISVIGSALISTLYLVTKLGPGQLLIAHGIATFYRGQLGLP